MVRASIELAAISLFTAAVLLWADHGGGFVMLVRAGGW